MFNEQKPEILNFKNIISNSFGGHRGMVNTVCICKQRNLLASGSDDKTVKLWNLQNNSLIKTYKNYGRVYTQYDIVLEFTQMGLEFTYLFHQLLNLQFVVVFSNQGNLLAFGGDGDYSIMVINIIDLKRNYNIIWKFKGHTGSIMKLRFSNDSNYLISMSGRTVKIWDINLKKESFQLNSDCDLAININNFITTITNKDGKVRIWDLKNQKQLCSQQVHTVGNGFAFSNDQKMLVSIGWSHCMIKLWNLEKVNQNKLLLIRKFNIETKQYCTVQFSACSGLIICISPKVEEIKLIDSQTGNLVKYFRPYEELVTQLHYVANLKDMDIIAYGEENNRILVWRCQ